MATTPTVRIQDPQPRRSQRRRQRTHRLPPEGPYPYGNANEGNHDAIRNVPFSTFTPLREYSPDTHNASEHLLVPVNIAEPTRSEPLGQASSASSTSMIGIPSRTG